MELEAGGPLGQKLRFHPEVKGNLTRKWEVAF